jgi:putative photosynthetic complex assembly protein 2
VTALAITGALVFALVLWWTGTGAVLWLERRDGLRRIAFAGVSVAAVGAVVALWLTRDRATPAGAFIAFSAAVAVWGWHELSFLAGVLTGPSARPCPETARGWARFRLATATLIHHEMALAATAAALAALTLGSANPIGGLTFLVLFAARLSAKLNLFLGVPNFSAEFFPARLRYLTSYMRKGPVSALFPVSVIALSGAAALAASRAFDPQATAFEATGFALVLGLTGLAALEHLFMAAPIADSALWRWALPAAERAALRPTSLPARPDPIKTPG